MADTPERDAIIKKEPEVPEADPIVSRSTSSILLVCALLLTGTLAWALYDEVYGQRPWKSIQQTFVERYSRYLRTLRRRGRENPPDKEIKESEEYQRLDAEARSALSAVKPRRDEIDREVKLIDDKLAVITDPFQNARGYITVINYRVETTHDEEKKNSYRKEIDELKQEKTTVQMPVGDGKVEKQELTYPQIEQLFNSLKDQKARLLGERAEILKVPSELEKKRDDYLKDNVIGLTPDQINGLLTKTRSFDFSIRQINVNDANIVDRCETCHLGVREPLEITPAVMRERGKRNPDSLARAFVSHPNRDLLRIHDPERFGCSSCHGGNGRATTTIEKAHGKNKHWLYPLYSKKNIEAGCQQCHSTDRVLMGASTLNLGKDLFQERGCVGCHRYEGFDRETDALANTQQSVKRLTEEIAGNEREAKAAAAGVANAPDDETAQRLLARAESLRVTNSQLEARVDQLNVQARYLMQDQKKVGPNLKDVRLKLRKEWIPEWLRNPQDFRPGTKMPTYWRIDGEEARAHGREREVNERKAIAAYLWQESFEGQLEQQQQGDGAHGKQLFETRGCLACHSVGEGNQAIGGNFAANLTRVGEKASYDYIVRWIHNPRERYRPYCPKEKRDLTEEDYRKNGKPFVFDTELHSRCPNDGAELQVQNMTVMPNFRLSEQDSRDIATYLFSLSGQSSYPEASFMDDPRLKDHGRTLIKQYGCAGCHEIKGFEDEQRIGKELTTEGATPIERLDFALLTHDAEKGVNPYTGEKREPWYTRKGFFEHKLATPWIYDQGKEKEPQDMLRMPQPYLTDEWRNALVTFLMGSVGQEGASVPTSLFYKPANQQKDIQEGWWVIKKYNCMGCHTVQVGQDSVLAALPLYESPENRDKLPPALTTEGARVDPDWLMRFLKDPSLSEHTGGASQSGANGGVSPSHAQSTGTGAATSGGGQTNGNNQQSGQRATNAGRAGGALPPQPGENRNGVRPYLDVRMPTFNFSPNELRALVRFFMAVSSQQEPYIKEQLEPLTNQELDLARALFTSQAAPCLKCHVTGDPAFDKAASAPNFLQASERLKPDWTLRWIVDPQRIIPGTAMPSGLFQRDRELERWVFNGPIPESAGEYRGDHARLLVRYMLQLTPDEQRRLASMIQTTPVPATSPTVATHNGLRTPQSTSKPPPTRSASARAPGRSQSRRGRQQASVVIPRRETSAVARAPGVVWRRNIGGL